MVSGKGDIDTSTWEGGWIISSTWRERSCKTPNAQTDERDVDPHEDNARVRLDANVTSDPRSVESPQSLGWRAETLDFSGCQRCFQMYY